jgi:microsomal dipeptidase-like Zn-dependent dipeptidase
VPGRDQDVLAPPGTADDRQARRRHRPRALPDLARRKRPHLGQDPLGHRPQEYLETGEWSPAAYPPPPYLYPKDIETPDKAANLTDGLLRAGFTTEEAQKIIGGNWMRVFREV